VVGEFSGNKEASTQGRLGDIRGLPDKDDLDKVKRDATRIINIIKESTEAK
jgi:hypothetical protein